MCEIAAICADWRKKCNRHNTIPVLGEISRIPRSLIWLLLARCRGPGGLLPSRQNDVLARLGRCLRAQWPRKLAVRDRMGSGPRDWERMTFPFQGSRCVTWALLICLLSWCFRSIGSSRNGRHNAPARLAQFQRSPVAQRGRGGKSRASCRSARHVKAASDAVGKRTKAMSASTKWLKRKLRLD